jgi:hypothetical protein
MTVSNELIDQLLAGYKKPEDLIGENGLLKQLTKRLDVALPGGSTLKSCKIEHALSVILSRYSEMSPILLLARHVRSHPRRYR